MLNLKILNDFVTTARNTFVRNNSSIKRSTKAPKLILYGDEVSPPVRFVMMTASILDIGLDFRRIDLFAAENKTEFYKKINPLQKVPVLVTYIKTICDSHAISLFLCRNWDNKYILYPKDAVAKAKVDEMLFFNSSTLFPIDSEIFTNFFAGRPADESKTEDWFRAIDVLEHRLSEHPWLAGDRMLLSDICVATTITSLQCLIPLADRHVRLKLWLNEMEKQPFFQINKRGLERLNKFIQATNNQTSNFSDK